MSRTQISIRDLRKTPLTLKTGERHTIILTGFEGSILEMEDLHFHHDSAVLLPDPTCDDGASGDDNGDASDDGDGTDPQQRITGLAVLRACYMFAADNSTQRMLIAGHADSSGESADYNFRISKLRADNVLCALTGDRAGWVKIADARHKVEDYQQILLWASYTYGWDCNPGAIDDEAGPITEAAVRGFQKRYNVEFPDTSIAVDGVVGVETWGAFFDLYMRELAELMDTDADGLQKARGNLQFVDAGRKTVGCGASHPIGSVADASKRAPIFSKDTKKVPLAEAYRSSLNRRVELLFFAPGQEPQLSCHADEKCRPAKCEIYGGCYTLVHIPCEGALNPRLVSRLALDWLEQAANKIDENEFLAWASTVFGSDIPLDAYRTWRADLVAGTLKPPHIRLVDAGVLGDEPGDYNDDTEEIRVVKDLPLKAETSPSDAAKLFLILLHEFGHHIDNLLRRRYTDPPVDGDAPGEEGSVFAFGIAGLNQHETDHQVFARYIHDGDSHELQLSYPELHQAVKNYIADPDKQNQAKQNNVEGFSEGYGRPESNFFGHRSIEYGLSDADPVFFSSLVRDRIYFGNWERDYSQFCGSSTLRALQILEGPAALTKAKNLPRRALTEYLDRKAKAEFPTIQPTHVTMANLGVYRPEEHVDNPQGLADDRAVDPQFRRGVTDEELEVDPTTGIKNYIANDGQNWRTSSAYVAESLRGAVAAGLTDEGFRLLGQALHVVEDIYAHSNFVELTLIRLGHSLVFPWVGLNSEVIVRGDRRFPLVTGVFGYVDAMVSVLSSIGEAFAPPIACEGQVFSKTSVEVVTLLLNALANSSAMEGLLVPSIETLLVNKDAIGKDLTDFSKALCDASEASKGWIKRKLGAVLRATLRQLALFEGDFIKDIATSGRTNPTHSMLAKDHPDHPLHAVAAACARAAVASVGLAMRNAWLRRAPWTTPDEPSPIDDVIRVANGFFIHPNDIPLVSGDARADLVVKIDTFAKANPGVVSHLDIPGSLGTFHKHSEEERAKLSLRADDMIDHDEAGADRALALLPDLDPKIWTTG
jgi:peptidoglycan hydrolase-like protein with peptidoglycan-binding domain